MIRLHDRLIVVSGISFINLMTSNNCNRGIFSFVMKLDCITKLIVNIPLTFLFLRTFVPIWMIFGTCVVNPNRLKTEYPVM